MLQRGRFDYGKKIEITDSRNYKAVAGTKLRGLLQNYVHRDRAKRVSKIRKFMSDDPFGTALWYAISLF